ncbi:hypothetical protein KZZ52_57025 [Dactylosporangium sp. AC04546]|nr:hypothetical protein [Dactylosporangium sp. AC04546]WVK83314.1 hypothetical protein KZZ52_57025 [Dactylosporangium sp. AC04546]
MAVADAAAHHDALAGQVERAVERRAQGGRRAFRRRAVGARAQHRELVAAQPCHDGAAVGGGAQALADGGQQLVADAVAVGVVDRLEVVEVDEHDRVRLDRSVQMLPEHCAVRQAGECVVVRGVVQGLLVQPLRAHVEQREHCAGAVGLGSHRYRLDQDVAAGAVGAQELDLQRRCLSTGPGRSGNGGSRHGRSGHGCSRHGGSRHGGQVDRAAVAGGEAQVAEAGAGAGRPAEQVAGGRVGHHDGAGRVGDHDRKGQPLQYRVEQRAL